MIIHNISGPLCVWEQINLAEHLHRALTVILDGGHSHYLCIFSQFYTIFYRYLCTKLWPKSGQGGYFFKLSFEFSFTEVWCRSDFFFWPNTRYLIFEREKKIRKGERKIGKRLLINDYSFAWRKQQSVKNSCMFKNLSQ